MKRFLAGIALAMFLSISALADTLIIPTQYATIQEGMNAASSGDLIIVLPGVYLENVDFLGKAVTLRSDGDGDPATYDIRPEKTVIDAGMKGSGVVFSSGEGFGSILDGFTLTNGTGTGTGGTTYGGGISCAQASSPVIANNIVADNYANGGGGISCVDGSSPKILNNTVIGNESKGSGGGIRCHKACDAFISGNFVKGNRAGSKGAGMFLAYSVPVVRDNIVIENIAPTGAGIFCGWSPDTMILEDLIIVGNRAEFGVAGGLGIDASKLSAVNILIADNEGVNAGGIYCAWCKPTLTNLTVVGNKAKTYGGGIWCVTAQPVITNVIFWGNTAPQGPEIEAIAGNPDVSYCDVKGGYPGLGNIDLDPLFVNAAGGDYHLRYTSPCRDAGSNGAPGLPGKDFEGDPRSSQGQADIGADEFHPHLYYTGLAAPGGSIEVKVIGVPSTAPLLLWIGSGIRDNPLPTVHGNWFLQLPILLQVALDPVPMDGVAILAYDFPPDFPVPWLVTMQALVGQSLSNFAEMNIK
jgi:predicted outer membrane repeat protein